MIGLVHGDDSKAWSAVDSKSNALLKDSLKDYVYRISFWILKPEET